MGLKKDCLKNVVDKLTSYAVIQKSIEYLENKIKAINEELLKIKTSRFEESRGGIVVSRNEKLLDDKATLNNKLNDLKFEMKSIMGIVNILDGIEREVIVDFYFKKYSVSKIAKERAYSESYIRKIKINAINKINNTCHIN